MPGASRLEDQSFCAADSHGNICCAHAVIGPAVTASDNVIVNGRGALRIGDDGVHELCCGPNEWKATHGSGTVLVNGRGAVRIGDETKHCGGEGNMVEGSGNVIVGG